MIPGTMARVLLAAAGLAAVFRDCEGFGMLAAGPELRAGGRVGRPGYELCNLRMAGSQPGPEASAAKAAANGKSKVLAGAALLSVSICTPQPSRASGGLLDATGVPFTPTAMRCMPSGVTPHAACNCRRTRSR